MVPLRSRCGPDRASGPPADASGVRLRFWPSEGLDPEYIDIDLPGNPPGNAATHLIDTASLDFDRPGPHSRLVSGAG